MLCTMKRWNKWKHETSIFPKFEVIFLGTRSRFYMTSPSSSSTASFDIHTHTYIYMLFLFRVVFSVCLLFALLFFLGHGFWGTPLGKEKALFRIRGSRTLFGSDWGSFLVLFWSSSSSSSSSSCVCSLHRNIFAGKKSGG